MTGRRGGGDTSIAKVFRDHLPEEVLFSTQLHPKETTKAMVTPLTSHVTLDKPLKFFRPQLYHLKELE